MPTVTAKLLNKLDSETYALQTTLKFLFTIYTAVADKSVRISREAHERLRSAI